MAHVVSVELLDTRGRLLTALDAGAGNTIDRFLLLYPVRGQYVLETRVDGQLVKRFVNLRLGQTVRANLMESVSQRFPVPRGASIHTVTDSGGLDPQ